MSQGVRNEAAHGAQDATGQPWRIGRGAPYADVATAGYGTRKKGRAVNWNDVRKTLDERGEVSIRPSGNSMVPKIRSRQLVTIRKGNAGLKKGDIVFCKVRGSFYLHLVTALKGGQAQISNNHGHVNGWCSLDAVYGQVVRVEA